MSSPNPALISAMAQAMYDCDHRHEPKVELASVPYDVQRPYRQHAIYAFVAFVSFTGQADPGAPR